MSDPLIVGGKFYVDHKTTWGPGRKTVMLSFAGGAQLTDFDISTRHNMKPSTVRPRRVELWRQGYLEPVGMKQHGRQRIQVWGATPMGDAQIKILQNGGEDRGTFAGWDWEKDDHVDVI
jgi:hypothetical protein